MTYQPMAFCKGVVFFLWAGALLLTRLLPGTPATELVALGAVPLWFYLKNLRVKIVDDCLIKSTGRLFKSETVLPIKNIWRLQNISVLPRFGFLPGAIRVFCPGQTVLILGLDGRQCARIKDTIMASRLEKL